MPSVKITGSCEAASLLEREENILEGSRAGM